MIALINRLIAKVKGPEYRLNEKIYGGYVCGFVAGKIYERLNGLLRFRRKTAAYVGRSVTLKAKRLMKFGAGLTVARGCYIDALGEEGIVCGHNVSFGMNTTMIVSGSLRFLGKGIVIGNNVGLGTHGYYGGAGGLEIGDNTIIGNFVSMHPENHNYTDPNIPIRLQGVNHKGIKVGRNCWIGAKATILDGTVLGDGCIVAAGAVVSGKFPDNVIIGGIPARVLKNRC